MNIVIIFALSFPIHAQVTIGSSFKSKGGALLDLKEMDSLGNVTATKGLGLPRVGLIDNKNLYPMFDNDGSGGYADASKLEEDANHVGLIVYNLTEITTDEESRLCKGIHVWNGNKWKPLSPYPDHSSKFIRIGKHDDFVDIRGPSGIETNTYHTSRFAVLQSGDPYSCNPNEELKFLDAGIWMTENLYTKYAPSGQSIILNVDQALSPGYTYTVTDSDPKSWGLGYNWAAATVGPDGIYGKGGSTGNDFNIDEKEVDIDIVQGICPNGWHLPSTKEYKLLYEVVEASNDFTTEAPPVGKSAFSFLLNDNPSTGTNEGVSKPAVEGGFGGLQVGWQRGKLGLGELATFWTASAGRNFYVYYARMQRTININNNFLPFVSGGTRPSYAPVRCKKDEN